MTAAPARAGFTLMEVLVALLIFGIIAATASITLSGAMTARRAGQDADARLAAFQRTRAMLATDIEQAADRRLRDLSGRTAPGALLSGAEAGGALLVLTRSGWSNPDGRPRPSIQAVEYRIVEGRLERRARPQLDGAALGPPQVLYRGVREAGVVFLDRGQTLTAWRGETDRPLPQAVRITLTLDGFGPVEQTFLTGAAS